MGYPVLPYLDLYVCFLYYRLFAMSHNSILLLQHFLIFFPSGIMILIFWHRLWSARRLKLIKVDTYIVNIWHFLISFWAIPPLFGGLPWIDSLWYEGPPPLYGLPYISYYNTYHIQMDYSVYIMFASVYYAMIMVIYGPKHLSEKEKVHLSADILFAFIWIRMMTELLLFSFLPVCRLYWGMF